MKHFILNLSLARKFLLVALVAGVMLAVPSAIVINDSFAVIRFNQQERSGLRPAGELLTLLQLTQQHRGLSAAVLEGNAALTAQRQAKRDEVNRRLAQAKVAAAALRDDKLNGAFDKLAAGWSALTQAVDTRTITGPDSFARHATLIADQLDALHRITHASGIVLHPEAGGYYLQNGVLLLLPEVSEALGQIRARGMLALTRGEIGADDRLFIHAQWLRATSALASARRSFALAGESSRELSAVIDRTWTQASAATDKVLKLADAKILKAEKAEHSATDFFATATEAIDQQFVVITAGLGALDQLLQDQAVALWRRLAVTAACILALGLVAAWILWTVARTTARGVRRAAAMASAVANGDLSVTVTVTGRDEVAQLLEAMSRMRESLIQIVGSVRNNAESVATASAQIAQGNLDLSGRTEQQASALQQTAATMEELGATVRLNADNAREANQLTVSASAVAEQGGEVVGQVVETMRGIEQSSRQISDIIAVIDGIAFQTNILALNAAVEAARAGEQGRGFAVVAAEVRSLAQRSAEAAKEIKTLITASVERVSQGTELVDRAGRTMHEVVESIRRVNDIMSQISAASTEQSAGVSQVGEAITQMDQSTQQNAALVEESAAAAASLKQQAEQLRTAVAVFRMAGEPSGADVSHA